MLLVVQCIILIALFTDFGTSYSVSSGYSVRGYSVKRKFHATQSLINSVSELSQSQLNFDSSTPENKPKVPRVRVFDRTNRVDGQLIWMKEICLLSVQRSRESLQFNHSVTNIAFITEIAKELLYSGIPEQVLELYSSYYDIILRPKAAKIVAYTKKEKREQLERERIANADPNNDMPIVPDIKLIGVTVRAFIALNDVKGAVKLLQAVSRVGLNFDSESKSMLLADLAECSAEGLNAALQIRRSMREKNESLSALAYAGILTGIRQHGLGKKKNSVVKLLMGAADEADQLALDAELGTAFLLTSEKAYDLAHELLSDYLSQEERKALSRFPDSSENSKTKESSKHKTNVKTGKTGGKVKRSFKVAIASCTLPILALF